MNKKGYRANNDEGSIYETIQKIDRKKNRLNFICNICKNCTDKSICNNREGTKKCKKCEECTECLKRGFCDRFYCYKVTQAQITVNGKQTTVANSKKKNEAINKKQKAQSKVLSNSYVEKNGATILEIVKNIDDQKFKSNIIGTNTKNKNKYLYKKLETSEFAYTPLQKTTSTMIQNFLDSLTEDLSQSEIHKYYDKINIAIKYALSKGWLAMNNNPLTEVHIPISSKNVKKVEAFSIEEERKLITYLCTHPKLVSNVRCEYDDRTIRNLILIALFSLARCGELGALKIDSDIDLEHKKLKIDETISKDENGIPIIGKTTKTGTKNKLAGNPDSRIVPFNLFDEKIFMHILDDQIENAKSNKNIKENLLFCRKDGQYINHSQITSILKRICREANIKSNLSTGCHIHMTRHTGITRLYEFGVDVLVIAKISGHMDAGQFYKTYGHILEEFILWQINHPHQYYTKEMLLTADVKKAINNVYLH